MDATSARARLRESGLRSTPSRLEVLLSLAHSTQPVSHSELVARLTPSRMNPATVYRNLVKLTEVGLARIATRAHGLTRYELVDPTETAPEQHPHFACRECGAVTCLKASLQTDAIAAEWRDAVRSARVQLEGICPTCRS